MQSPQEQRRIERQIHETLMSFAQGAARKALPDLDQEIVIACLKPFLDASHKELGVEPAAIEADQLREILLRYLPRRISARRKASQHAIEVISAFYAAELPEDRLQGLKPVLEEARQKFALVQSGEESIDAGVAVLEREADKVGRNDPCPCGSGKKYKHCHGA